jgi:glycosyltransferase involved in cell wall biosynthesis
MRIAVQASDLDHARIDGTRVYLLELLKRFGKLDTNDEFLLYHRGQFNPALTPPSFPHYTVQSLPFPKAWMQTRFVWEMFQHTPDKLFLPIQAAPVFLPRSVEVIATIHDLAWKRYPHTFPSRDRWKLDFMLETVLRQADKLIAVSASTKRDLLEFFPHVSESKIRVIHHGFDRDFFGNKLSEAELSEGLRNFQLTAKNYFLYVGALQPRKNLTRLIQAFEIMKRKCPESKLVLAGEAAWLASDILAARERSKYHDDIILTGRVSFRDLRTLYQGARAFLFPSLYEGFGIPLLEAFASGTPVLTADNSSLREVAGGGALYVDAVNVDDIAEKMCLLWQDRVLQQGLVQAGQGQLEQFSWDKCAEETLKYIQE